MSLTKTDPWYVSLPDSRSDREGNRRYARAVALSQMRRYIATYERRPELAKRHAQAIAYRKHCLLNWQDYLDGKFDPPTGRKPQQ